MKTHEIEHHSEVRLSHSPTRLAELNKTTLLTCLKNQDKIAVVTIDKMPTFYTYIQTIFHPQCVLVVDSRTIYVSMRDRRGDWHFVEMKAGENGSFVQTRNLKHSFSSGYNLCLLKGYDITANASHRILQCCRKSHTVTMFNMTSDKVFVYEIDSPEQCLVDQNYNIFILSHKNGIHVLNEDGSLRTGVSANNLVGSCCFTLNSDCSKIYVGNFGNGSIAVYRIVR